MKILYILALTFLLTLFYVPLNAGVEDVEYGAKPLIQLSEVEGKFIEGLRCVYKWNTKEGEYQGYDSQCINTNDTALITKKGDLFFLVPADNASAAVVNVCASNSLKGNMVKVQGEILGTKRIKTIKVTSFTIK
jgi:hypothetical protein